MCTFTVRTADSRSKTEAAIFVGLGVRRGVSDLLLWHRGRSFALELKAENGRTSAAQREFLADMERAGVLTAVAVGLDAALRRLEEWGLLRGRVQ